MQRPANVPTDWVHVEPGDAALTRRVKAAGPHALIQVKVRGRLMSRGVWAPPATVERIRADLEHERATDGHAKRQAAAALRRERVQAAYVDDFCAAVTAYLAFHPTHAALGELLARAVTEHATPVGSGTVARTERIPIERRAEAAVIAWMRHQTTAYDSMKIARVRGKRREVRRMLAARSKELLDRYRRSAPIDDDCPLQTALNGAV